MATQEECNSWHKNIERVLLDQAKVHLSPTFCFSSEAIQMPDGCSDAEAREITLFHCCSHAFYSTDGRYDLSPDMLIQQRLSYTTITS